MEEKEKRWKRIQHYIQSNFNLEPNVHNILFLIGIQELGYGFSQLSRETKTKVFNFASMYIMNYLNDEEKKMIRKENFHKNHFEEHIYKRAIINYFETKKIL